MNNYAADLDQITHIEHTDNFNRGLCLLLSAHTGVYTAVLWRSVSDGQLNGSAPLLNLVLLSVL